jgi:hypothetical protein
MFPLFELGEALSLPRLALADLLRFSICVADSARFASIVKALMRLLSRSLIGLDLAAHGTRWSRICVDAGKVVFSGIGQRLCWLTLTRRRGPFVRCVSSEESKEALLAGSRVKKEAGRDGLGAPDQARWRASRHWL